METLHHRASESAENLAPRLGLKPRVAIILGTGLGGLVRRIKDAREIPYPEIPHFPVPTVASHAGLVVGGRLGGKPVVAFEGRFHAYEGHSLETVTFPVRVAKALGCKILIVSNAAGGLNPGFRRGGLMAIEDHINLMGVNPLVGPNDDRLGPRFPDMCEPYSRRLLGIAERAALRLRIPLHRGVYVGVLGPNLETRAEYRFLRAIGADAVGMSTVPEVIAAVHAGLEVFGVSVISDECIPDALKPVDIEEIIRAAKTAAKPLAALVEAVAKEA